MKILVLNSGSSSQKSCLYEIGASLPEEPQHPLWEGKVEWRNGGAALAVHTSAGKKQSELLGKANRGEAIDALLKSLVAGETQTLKQLPEIDAVGHRVVNGGRKFTKPTRITPEVKTAIDGMAAFAPLHNRAELEGITQIEKACGAVPQVAVFDTGFHATLPDAAAIYPGPYEWAERGIRRFGFHGINHQYCAERAARLLRRDPSELKLVTCHLGNGCSLAAIRGGASVDTTMGFTPLEGLTMGTRSGSVDPGILTYLLREDGLNGNSLDELLNAKSGLLGISGVSSDMREIVAAMNAGNARAKLAFEIFVHRLRAGIASMTASLGGLDAVVFTAGIGENSAEVRAAACEGLEFLGVRLDPKKNRERGRDRDIAAKDGRVRVLVIAAQEDWAIARECWRMQRG
ncbi:MAG TPA: acetate kinase [Candidatus Acidoferrum sp.]|nr:acetate kinase [Candidatus Acidoferrum sp.]